MAAAGASGVQDAATTARAAQAVWAPVPAAARARFLRRSAVAILDALDPLADLLAAETGRPRTEALLADLLPTVGGLHDLADDGPKALRDERLGRIPALRAGRRTVLVHAPVGVVGVEAVVASPWRGPVLETAAAVLAGNGVVLSPSSAEVGRRIGAAFAASGLPDGLVTVVDPGEALGDHVDAVVSPDAPARKGVMLVLDGADVDRAVSGALWSAFARAGQGRAAVGTAVVVPSLARAFTDRIADAARALRVGDPRAEGTEVGEQVDAVRAARVAELVQAAVVEGAELLAGDPGLVAPVAHGGPDPTSTDAAPVVLRGVTPDAAVLREPVPGPVLAIVEAADADAAIAYAASLAPSVQVSVWSGDRAHGERVARALPAELTWVNEHGVAQPVARVLAREHTRIRRLASQPTRLRSARWLPYDPDLVAASVATARLWHGRERQRLATLRAGAVPLARTGARLLREALER